VQPESLAYFSYSDLLLEIPALGIKSPIVGVPYTVGGWDTTWLGNQVGWLDGSAFPSWVGNSVLTGHVYNQTGTAGPFINLANLKWGDQIIVHAYGQKFTYEVRSNRMITPNDNSVLGHKDRPWITLITCKGYSEEKQTYLWRIAVQAVLIEVK
jgi:LPXTG-site transpeptidase (sortase) family protein